MSKKLYSLSAVDEYIEKYNLIVDDIIEGCLLDTLIIYHDNGITEIFEETYLNCWSSAYTRHIYKKGMPERFQDALNEQA